MIRKAVSSSNLESVGYDPETEILEVEFKGKEIKAIWQYAPVPKLIYDFMMTAESVGKFFNAEIKSKKVIISETESKPKYTATKVFPIQPEAQLDSK